MMTEKKYNVVYEDSFKKELVKLSGKQQKMVLNKLRILEADPFYPSLRTKKLKGVRGDGRFESSVNMDIRVIWRFEGEKIIVMLDVGHHDVLKKY